MSSKRKTAPNLAAAGASALEPSRGEVGSKKKKRKIKNNEATLTEEEKLEAQFVALCEENPDGVREDLLQQEMGGVDIRKRAAIINSLLQRGRLQLFRSGESIVYKLVGNEDAKKFRGLGPEEMLVYQLVEKEHNTGIWIRDVRRRSNLQQRTINKILKTLLSRKLVKAVKTVQGNQKVYMLFDLEPAEELMGRAWCSGTEFDEGFMATLRKTCHKCIEHRGSGTAEDLLAFVRQSGIFQVSIGVKDIVAIMKSMVFDGVIEPDPSHLSLLNLSASMSEDKKQAILKHRLVKKGALVSPYLSIPCSVCPVADKCCEGGVISPAACEYMGQWLDF